MNEHKSILAEELKPLNAQIDRMRAEIARREDELRDAEYELATLTADRQRFDALREICTALDRLSELNAEELFWNELPGLENGAANLARLRERIDAFEGDFRGVEEKTAACQTHIDRGFDELDYLNEEVREAYAREERRLEEFVIEREVSPMPFRSMVMPWTGDAESERRFRKAMSIAMLFSLLCGILIPMVTVPIPDRNDMVVEIPERLAMLVKKEPPKPEPIARPQSKPEELKPEAEEKTLDKTKKKSAKPQTQVANNAPEARAARKKAETTGVLAFQHTFKDLMEETPVARLGTEARISSKKAAAAGQARASRSLVAIQAASGSGGGVAVAGTSRNLGVGGGGSGDKIGGVGFARVGSAVAGLAEEAGRPVSDGLGAVRTDEEIQIVFDRYKATLYRIYNKQLRKDPTLRGKILLKITIEESGAVSACSVESTDLDSDELVTQIVARVERFNFGPKDDVAKVTILYPIDFLPAG